MYFYMKNLFKIILYKR